MNGRDNGGGPNPGADRELIAEARAVVLIYGAGPVTVQALNGVTCQSAWYLLVKGVSNRVPYGLSQSGSASLSGGTRQRSIG